VSILQAVVMGFLQGATEFLPVSSSGHLVLVPWLLGWEGPGLTFGTVVHLGTLVAVVLYFRQQIGQLLSGWWQSIRIQSLVTEDARLSWLILVSAVPGALLGYLGESFFERLFGRPRAVSVMLLATGALLVLSESMGRKARALHEMRWGDALAVGLAQGCAIAPGLSRSGVTIAAGLRLGLRRDQAARFSFLMAIPITAGAAGVRLLRMVSAVRGLSPAGVIVSQIPHLVAGFVAALLTGYFAIRFLMDYLSRHSLRPFAYYCWAFGLLSLVLSLLPAWA